MATKVMNGLDLQSQKITNLATPTVSTDAASKGYVDSAIQGIEWRQPARAAAASNITISGPGTAIDGVTLANGDRVLLTAQTTGSQNGIWVFNGSAAALTRPTDYATGATVGAGLALSIMDGTTYADHLFMLYTPDSATVDTTSTTWGQLAGGGATYTAGNGLQLTSNQFSVKNADSTINVTGSGISVNPSALSFTKKYATTLTAGSTSYTVTHSLGTTDILVQVYDNSGNLVMPDVQATSTTTATITFGATTAVAYRCVVIG
ncbi:hypothetical protein [Nocardia jiangxiensis]|uniref:hypothetical protein n=1 Tax=Nocardia jiangxiensis TaxID=282685 RepID=UPI00032011A8|nr:hypothetical protein [Nocardia jiangxiensis]